MFCHLGYVEKNQEYSAQAFVFPTEIMWIWQEIPFMPLLSSAFICHSLSNSFQKATLWEEHSALSPIHSSQYVHSF